MGVINLTVIEKKNDIVELDIIEKYNPYHDSRGRFTSAGAAASVTFGGKGGKGQQTALANAKKIHADSEKHKEGDKAAIAGKIQHVKNACSTETKPITRKSADIDKIMKEAGCDRDTATKAAKAAKDLYDRYEKAEPTITGDILEAVKANNGTMYGLDFRMKQETSLGRKIAQDAAEDGVSLDVAASKIKDCVRYTTIIESSNFTQGYNNIKKSLEDKGYVEERNKNYFDMYAKGKADQKAVQCVYRDKNGNRLELQFHTPESQGAKEVNHPLYEEARQTNTSKHDKAVYSQRMKNITSNVPIPDGVMNIKSHG